LVLEFGACLQSVRKVTEQFRSGYIKVGDKVFWSTYGVFVTVLEVPCEEKYKFYLDGLDVIVCCPTGEVMKAKHTQLWKWDFSEDAFKVKYSHPDLFVNTVELLYNQRSML